MLVIQLLVYERGGFRGGFDGARDGRGGRRRERGKRRRRGKKKRDCGKKRGSGKTGAKEWVTKLGAQSEMERLIFLKKSVFAGS